MDTIDRKEEESNEKARQKRAEFMCSINIAEDLKDDELNRIGANVVEEFNNDEATREEWKQVTQEAMDQALQKKEGKSFPFEGAANVKYPLLTTASIQFGARTYPQLVKDQKIVKCKVIGKDEGGAKAARADRVSSHMSYQFLEEMDGWEEDMDMLLHQIPNTGCAFKKIFYSHEKGKNESIMVPAINLCVNHDTTKDIRKCPRITHILNEYPYEIEEKRRVGIYLDVKVDSKEGTEEKEQGPVELLEQHRLEDLDGDGYPEPYIITVERATSKVLRIVANYEKQDVRADEQGRVVRIERQEYFVKYGFIPNPDGGYYDVGFGHLLQSISDTTNTTINQLLDAGTIQNAGGGFVGSGVNLSKRGNSQIKMRPGHWQTVQAPGNKIREAMVPNEHPGPSPVLFQLLGLFIDAGKDITSINDALLGDLPANVALETQLSTVEQSTKVMSAINKRLHRSMGEEFKIAYGLNARYLSEFGYFNYHDTEEAVRRSDYNIKDLNVMPSADPNMVSDTQAILRSQAVLNASQQHPDLISKKKALDGYFKALKVDDYEQYYYTEQEQAMMNQPPPEVVAEMEEKEAKTLETITKALKNVAEAEEKEPGDQLAIYAEALADLMEIANGGNEGGMGDMEIQPDDQMVHEGDIIAAANAAGLSPEGDIHAVEPGPEPIQ